MAIAVGRSPASTRPSRAARSSSTRARLCTGDRLVTNGGRILAVTGLGEDVAVARSAAYDAVRRIDFPGARHRSDIAEAAGLGVAVNAAVPPGS
jgi:phosphoribosylamine--glycine ligase